MSYLQDERICMISIYYIPTIDARKNILNNIKHILTENKDAILADIVKEFAENTVVKYEVTDILSDKTDFTNHHTIYNGFQQGRIRIVGNWYRDKLGSKRTNRGKHYFLKVKLTQIFKKYFPTVPVPPLNYYIKYVHYI